MTRTSKVGLLGLVAAVTLLLTMPSMAGSLDLEAKGRTESDQDRDSYNKPEELFAFWGIKGGMKVMDLYPGDGWTTLVLLAAGCKVIGNIEVGEGAKVGAGSVVLQDVPPHVTVAGVPAVVVGRPADESPAFAMDHSLK